MDEYHKIAQQVLDDCSSEDPDEIMEQLRNQYGVTDEETWQDLVERLIDLTPPHPAELDGRPALIRGFGEFPNDSENFNYWIATVRYAPTPQPIAETT